MQPPSGILWRICTNRVKGNNYSVTREVSLLQEVVPFSWKEYSWWARMTESVQLRIQRFCEGILQFEIIRPEINLIFDILSLAL